jgi:8-oxo-dGTP pyrophosphatase MutT (NUDIX family)
MRDDAFATDADPSPSAVVPPSGPNAEQGIEPILRPAARLLVISPEDRVLLFKWTHELLRAPGQSVWITPGGGVDAGETHEEAALRELREETGLGLPIGPCVWLRRHVFPWRPVPIDQRERFYVVRCDSTELSRDGWTPGELRHMSEGRWWSVEEIGASDDWFAPRALALPLPPILRGEYPAEPLEIGV